VRQGEGHPELGATHAGARYTRVARALHWAVALLLLVATGLALFRETFSAQAVWMISAHKVAGLGVLGLALARVAWRLTHRPPPFPDEVGRLEARVARAVHWALYVLMIVVPVAGWVFTSHAPFERPLDYRGRETVPALPLGRDDAASFAWHEAHELLGFALISLIALHVLAVLRHRLFGVRPLLDRMLAPGGGLSRRLILAAGLLWLVGLALDMLGVRIS
jgi:cytochrome b561